MSTITFDTLKYAERLEKAGLTREQATAIIEAQKESLAEALDTQLATKADTEALRSDLRETKAELNGKLALVHWMLAAVLAIAVANFAKQFF